MNCSDLKRWLDSGMPRVSEPDAREHAARCERCASSLEAEREIDALLRRDRAAALPDRSRFIDQVMERVRFAERPTSRIELWPAMSPLPWWVEAASDPGALLACLLAALLVWRPDWLAALARLLSDRWSVIAWPAIAQARATLGLDRPTIALGLGLLALLALAWASFHLYRWIERLARRSAGA